MSIGINSYTGNDTILLMGLPLSNFGTGKILEITWDNTLVTQKVGKNGNSVSVYTPGGNQAKATLKVMRASFDDIMIDTLLKQMKANFPIFAPINLVANKNFGFSSGFNLGSIGTSTPVNTPVIDTMNLYGGVFSKNPAVITDIDGDVEQSYMAYEMLFPNFTRIQS
jgi:hypothetical protein